MKKVILLLVSFSFLLQSCYSYRDINKDTNSLLISKTYKIKEGKRCYKGVLVSFNDSIIIINKHSKQKKYSLEKISKISQRKFSTVKTILLPITIITGFLAIVVVSYDGPQIGEINLIEIKK